MFSIRQIMTYIGAQPSFVTNLTDLQVVQQSGGYCLYSATQIGGGLAAFRLSGADKPLQLLSAQAYSSAARYLEAPDAALVTLGGGMALFATGIGGGWTNGFGIDQTGATAGTVRIGGLPADVTQFGSFQLAGGDYLYTTRNGSTAVETWRLRADGGIDWVARSQLPVGRGTQGVEITDIELVTLGDRTFILSASSLGNYVSAQMVRENGSLGSAQILGAERGFGLNGPAHLETVRVAGITYVIVGSAQSSSLTTLRLNYDGAMSHADHIIDELTTRFQSISALETVTVNGRAFVIAGGGDDGLSVFTLLPDGHLLHLATLTDNASRAMRDISAISAIEIDGQIAVFVSSRSERGITQFIFDPGQIGLTRILPAGQHIGTAGADLLQSGVGTTAIYGGAGNDILVAATAEIKLFGGDGADLFVAAPVEGRIMIMDFQPGVDRLDLSGLGMVRSTLQLTFRTFDNGIRITFGDTRIEIRTRNGSSLDAGAFDNSMFPVAHYEVSGMRTILTGTAAADSLTAGRFGSNLFGYGGNDLLIGHIGNDRIDGGAGNDTLSGADDSDRLAGGDGHDILRGGNGNDTLLGDNHGDTLFGGAGNDRIEGGAGNDHIYGDDGNDNIVDSRGNNRIWGGSGNDSIYGSTGVDRMDGGAGADTLLGGAGADRLIGGSGNDRITGHGGRDTLLGGAGNDSAMGGTDNDNIFGDHGHDALWGESGNDWLSSGDGNDRLSGGDGFDTLRGGTGDDWLSGGNQIDQIYGEAGHDRLFGGAANDLMSGGSGNDHLAGEAGNDVLWGDLGNDTLSGGGGNDSIHAGYGFNLIYGDAGNDLIAGHRRQDRIMGGAGDDRISGNGGSDWIDGGSGSDTIRSGTARATGGRNILNGGSGNDLILGGRDIDWITGGSGRDRMAGGAGADLFIFRSAADFDHSTDIITDFARGIDHIDLRGMDLRFVGRAAFSGSAEVRLWASPVQGLMVDIDLDGNRITDLRLALGQVANLTAGDFLL